MENKFKWESKIDYDFRIETGKISHEIAKSLKEIENKKFDEAPSNLNKQYNILKNIIVPEKYNIVYMYFLNCIKSYLDGANYLKNLNNENILKAARYIKKGNCFMELSKIEIFETIEKMQKLKN